MAYVSARSQSVRPCTARSLLLTALSLALLTIFTDNGWSQQLQRFHSRPRPIPEAVAPQVDTASPLGQALAACDKEAAAQETFVLPGLKGDVTLDRCYKGRDHLVCVFDTLISEAKSLTESYTKIVDAKYPEFSTVENICRIGQDALASDIAGSEDFTKRFAVLRTKYETASKCAMTVKQAFHDVVLSDMAQPPEILKSMTEAIEGDINRVAEVENQIVDLDAKMEAAKKAMKTIDKIHRTMCMKKETVSESEDTKAVSASEKTKPDSAPNKTN